MRKKRIIIIIICVFLLAVTALTFSRGLKMDPELAAVGNMGGAAPAEDAGESESEEHAADPENAPPAQAPDDMNSDGRSWA